MQCIVGINSSIASAQLILSTSTNDITHTTTRELSITEENCVWKRNEPTVMAFMVYAFIVPVLSCFGLCANFMNAIVFMRPKMTPSAFSYLAALAWLDCLSCLLILLTALSRSIFFNSHIWMAYDFQLQTPLFGISTGAANLLLGSVSCDRFIYLRYGLNNGNVPPRFCRRRVARRVIIVVIFTSVLLNLPYFFIFEVNDDGTFITHQLYYTTYYKIHNWCTFILLTILPALFLTIGNITIVIVFRRWTKQSKKCHQRNGNVNAKIMRKRYRHQLKLTITIIILIALYMIGELPAALTSRKNALNLLFGGDVNRVNFQLMEQLDMICLTLNALQLSINIIVYAVINPSFMPEFFGCLRSASDFCCGVFCLTPLIRWMSSNCCKAPSKPEMNVNVNVPSVTEHEIVTARNEFDFSTLYADEGRTVHQNSARCSVTSSVSANGNWDTEPEEDGGVLGFDLYRYWRNNVNTPGTPKRYRCSNEYRKDKHDQVWTTNTVWKRSSSFGNCGCDNLALDVVAIGGKIKQEQLETTESCDYRVTTPSSKQKRHSLAF
ncbi:uncharacterized protein LOC101453239 [Ceratitis capitata]|uniref:uncharacterized protein LOC101453239 n=1 Tax=Ceratitis capitata TaxID=7213 RepID=UPI0003296A32|nr:uncharacterized protein LOC101453239 [Ceratitis capitata]